MSETIVKVGGVEVDTTRRSVPVPADVLKGARGLVKEHGGYQRAGEVIGLSKDGLSDTLRRKTCHPSTLIKILKTLYPEQAKQTA